MIYVIDAPGGTLHLGFGSGRSVSVSTPRMGPGSREGEAYTHNRVKYAFSFGFKCEEVGFQLRSWKYGEGWFDHVERWDQQRKYPAKRPTYEQQERLCKKVLQIAQRWIDEHRELVVAGFEDAEEELRQYKMQRLEQEIKEAEEELRRRIDERKALLEQMRKLHGIREKREAKEVTV